MTELHVKGFNSIPDVVGFNRWGKCYTIECKVSRSDWRKEFNRKAKGTHFVGEEHYYLTPENLLDITEVGTRGILHYKAGKIEHFWGGKAQCSQHHYQILILQSICKRIRHHDPKAFSNGQKPYKNSWNRHRAK